MSETSVALRRREIVPSFAFFDVDETIISIKSMFEFYRYWCIFEHNDPTRWELFESTFARLREAGASRNDLNHAYYRFFRGELQSDLAASSQRWFAQILETRDNLYYEPVLAALYRHASSGVEPVFVSGSFEALLRPLADELGVTHILGAPLLVGDDGRLSGKLGSPQTIGEGKRAAVLRFLEEHGGLPSSCFAYGDDISDLPMLECVGFPNVVGERTALAAIAITRSWSVIDVHRNSAVPKAKD